MSYVTRSDMETRFGADEIQKIAGNGSTVSERVKCAREDAEQDGLDDAAINAAGEAERTRAEAEIAAAVATALKDTAGEIDAALAIWYELPLGAGPWPAIVAIQCELARLALFEDAAPEHVVVRANQKRKLLGMFSDGSRQLTDEDGQTAPRRNAPAQAAPEGLKITAESLEGY